MNKRIYDLVFGMCFIASVSLAVFTSGLLVYGNLWGPMTLEHFLLIPIVLFLTFVFTPIWLLILVVLVEAVERLIRPVVSVLAGDRDD